MEDNDKILADASQRAILRCGETEQKCLTLQEAVIAFHNLPDNHRETATIKLGNGTVYTASEIEKLYKADPSKKK